MEVEDEKEVEDKIKDSKLSRRTIVLTSYFILSAPVFIGIFIGNLFVKIFSALWLISLIFGWNEETKIKEKLKRMLKKVYKEINKDIEYQKSLLTGDYEKDRPIKWRITGMEALKTKCGLN